MNHQNISSKHKATPRTRHLSLLDRSVIWLSYGFGAGGLGLFMIFLWFGPFNLVALDLGPVSALALDTTLCLVFFVQHSLMARTGVQKIISAMVRKKYTPAVYSIVSGITLSALCFLWQGAGGIAAPHLLVKWLLHSLFFGAILGFIWGVRSLRHLDPFGIKDVLGKTDTAPPKLTIRGPYCFVRHPFYFFSLVMIWARPQVSADLVLFNLLFTIWFIVGSILEEKDLVQIFGQDYKDYQASVPMLFPYKRPL